MQIGLRRGFRAFALRIRSNEGRLKLETSVLESLFDGRFTLSTQLIKPNPPTIPLIVSLETYPFNYFSLVLLGFSIDPKVKKTA